MRNYKLDFLEEHKGEIYIHQVWGEKTQSELAQIFGVARETMRTFLHSKIYRALEVFMSDSVSLEILKKEHPDLDYEDVIALNRITIEEIREQVREIFPEL